MKTRTLLTGLTMILALGSMAVAYELKDILAFRDEIIGEYEQEKTEKEDGGKGSDPWVVAQMDTMKYAEEKDIVITHGGGIIKYGNVTVVNARHFGEYTTTTIHTTTTTTQPEYKGCCWEKMCLTDPDKCKDLDLKLNCFEDKECENEKP